MDVIWILSLWLLLTSGVLSNGMIANVSSRPAVVKVGAIFALNSTIGKVAKIAIEEALKDVNSNSSVLHGTKLVVEIRDCNCNVFVGMTEALQFMETDIVAVIGPQSSVVAHTILHVADELKTPFLSFSATDPTLASLQFPYFVRTTQSDKHQMTAIAEIVEYYGWKQVIVIFVDDDYGRNGLFALDDALADRLCRVSYKAGIPPGDVNRSVIMDILVKVALMESRVIVLHAYPASGFLVFSLAQYLGMMGDGYVWIATDWLSSVLDSSSPFHLQTMMDTMQGVLVLRQHTQDSESKREFSARWNKLTGGSLGLNSYALYAYDTVWMVAHAIDSFFNQGGVISFSNDSKLQAFREGKLHLDALVIFDGGPLLLKSILKSDFVGLTGQVKFSPDRFIVYPAYDIINIVGTGLHQIGYWSNYSGLSIVPPETLYSRPPNRSSANQQIYDVIWPGKTVRKPRGWVFPSNGKQLRIGVPNRFSYKEFVSQVPNTHTFKGFCIDVFTAAVNFLPYAVPYKFIPFGDGHENPNYTEIVNLITTGFFDGVVGDIAIVPNREKVVDFTQPFASAGLVVLVPVTELNSGAWAFLRPFSPALWGVTAAFFLFVGIVVWVLEHRINDDFRGPPMKQLTTVLWFSFSTLFFSHKEKPMSLLGRIVVLIWLFVVLIINSSYTAGLTSILTVQRLSSPIKGIESLKDGDDIIGYQVGSFAEQYLTNEIGIPKSRLKALGSPDEYAKALLQGPKKGGVTAVVDEHPYVEVFLSSHCKFRIVGQASTRSGWGFAFPRDSQLAVDLSTAILTLSENGELQRIHDKWFTKSLCTTDDTEIKSNRLHLSIFRGLFLMCGIVCVVAFVLYSWQIIHKYRKAVSVERASNGHGSAHSIRLQTLITLIDQKKDQSQRGRKRRKLLRDANQGE